MQSAVTIFCCGVLVAGCDQSEPEKPEVEGWAEIVRQPATDEGEMTIEVNDVQVREIVPATTRATLESDPVTRKRLEGTEWYPKWKESSASTTQPAK